MIKKGDKKLINGWVFYDWANSVYNLVISSAIFPIFYDEFTKAKYLAREGRTELLPDETVLVEFFGYDISSSVLISYVLSASFLVVSILSPILSGIADVSGSKKKFMQFFSYLGSIACITLFFFRDVPIELAMLSVFVASIGFWNSLVFYNAYLPEIAEEKDHDKISARGFSMGYFGAMILLILCLVWIQVLGQDAVWSFVFVGLWWMFFAQFTFRVLPKNVYGRKQEKGYVWKGLKELRVVFKEFKKTKRLKRYIYAFFFFNAGVQTVMLMATIFAKRVIEWPVNPETGETNNSGLIISILLIQILGALGAFIMSRLSGKIGNIKTLMISVLIWIGLCLTAFVITQPYEFYLLACGVGLVMGGVQALARSTYAKFLPETKDHASYFSFYDVTEKIGIVVGTFSFGLLEYLFNNIRFSVISISAFFVIGFVLLMFVPKKEKISEPA